MWGNSTYRETPEHARFIHDDQFSKARQGIKKQILNLPLINARITAEAIDGRDCGMVSSCHDLTLERVGEVYKGVEISHQKWNIP